MRPCAPPYLALLSKYTAGSVADDGGSVVTGAAAAPLTPVFTTAEAAEGSSSPTQHGSGALCAAVVFDGRSVCLFAQRFGARCCGAGSAETYGPQLSKLPDDRRPAVDARRLSSCQGCQCVAITDAADRRELEFCLPGINGGGASS